MGKIKEHEEKQKYLAVDDYILEKELDKIKETTGIKKINDTKWLIAKWYYF